MFIFPESGLNMDYGQAGGSVVSPELKFNFKALLFTQLIIFLYGVGRYMVEVAKEGIVGQRQREKMSAKY